MMRRNGVIDFGFCGLMCLGMAVHSSQVIASEEVPEREQLSRQRLEIERRSGPQPFELLGRPLDANDEVVADARLPVNHPRDRLQAHPGERGDIAHRGASTRPACAIRWAR